MNPPTSPHAPIDLRRLGLRLAGGLVVLVLTGFGVAYLFADPLQVVGGWFVRHYGAVGVGVTVAVLDTSPVPIPVEPVFLLALGGGLSGVSVGVAAAIGSLAAAPTGYLLGRMVGRMGVAHRVLGDHHEEAQELVRQYGFWGIALAALTPIPWGPCTWTAGAMQMPVVPFLLASLFRVPKVAFYLWLIHKAWSAAGGGG